MIDINLIRSNPELVRENIKKKFQDKKLPLVDEVIELDAKRRALIAEGDALRAARNTLSKQVGMLMKAGDKDGAEKIKAQVKADADRLLAIEKEAEEITYSYSILVKREKNQIPITRIKRYGINSTGSFVLTNIIQKNRTVYNSEPKKI